jgi:type III secretory pathway lipoprotein EscJ
VNREGAVQALSVIDTRRVLATRDSKTITNKGTMIPSREEQWFRYERSVAVSIEESLAALPGVLEARVHVNLPDDDPLFGDSVRKGGSGSVLLVVDRTFGAGDEEIAALVGGAAGLPRDVVRVLKSTAVEKEIPEVSQTTDSIPSAVLIDGTSRVPWVLAPVVMAMVGVGWGARLIRRRPQRKVRFELPKELNFEE